MGDSSTAMRDPIFYRWHAFIDDIFQEHKNTLPRYTIQQVRVDTNHCVYMLICFTSEIYFHTLKHTCDVRFIQHHFDCYCEQRRFFYL